MLLLDPKLVQGLSGQSAQDLSLHDLFSLTIQPPQLSGLTLMLLNDVRTVYDYKTPSSSHGCLSRDNLHFRLQ